MKDKFINEKWKAIEVKNMEPTEKYEVSSYGRIKSYKVDSEGKILKGATIAGYRIISIRLKKNKYKTVYIHKMVAELFVANSNGSKKLVGHLDYQKDNNHYKNLKWFTRDELSTHHRANPDRPVRIITNSKLTESKVRQIKKLLLKENITLYKVAAKFGITHTQLNRIRRGENWGHVTID